MELPVLLQGTRILTALLLGLAAGLAYDLFRGIRRLLPGITWLMDLLYGFVLLVGMLWLMLCSGGGMLRIYDLVAVLLGISVWFLTVSRWVLRFWLWILREFVRLIRTILLPVTKFFKILRHFSKKYFSFWRKWGKMIINLGSLWAGKHGCKGGNGSAVQEIVSADEDFDIGDGCVRYRYHGFSAESGDASHRRSRAAARSD